MLDRLAEGMDAAAMERFGACALEANGLLALGTRAFPSVRLGFRILWANSAAISSHLDWQAETRGDRIHLECHMAPDVVPPSRPFFDLMFHQVRYFPTLYGRPVIEPIVKQRDGHGLSMELYVEATPFDRAIEAGTRVLDRASEEFIALFRRRFAATPPPPMPSVELLRERIGLTPMEARIALLLAEGLDLKDIARDQSISVHTVRSHLRAIYSKTGANSQARLVSLVLLEGREID